MKRVSRHIAILLTCAFTVSAIGLPVAMYYCTMVGAYRTGACCCACPDQQPPIGEKISARACVEASDLGAPIKTAFTQAAQHKFFAATVVAFLPHATLLPAVFAAFRDAAPARDAIPPPLLRTSVLLI